jgi:hypothetical protein
MGGLEQGEWCVYDVFPNFVLCGDMGVVHVCLIGANGCMFVVLGESRVFRFFDPL